MFEDVLELAILAAAALGAGALGLVTGLVIGGRRGVAAQFAGDALLMLVDPGSARVDLVGVRRVADVLYEAVSEPLIAIIPPSIQPIFLRGRPTYVAVRVGGGMATAMAAPNLYTAAMVATWVVRMCGRDIDVLSPTGAAALAECVAETASEKVARVPVGPGLEYAVAVDGEALRRFLVTVSRANFVGLATALASIQRQSEALQRAAAAITAATRQSSLLKWVVVGLIVLAIVAIIGAALH